jgi:hypothetical protein
MSNKSLYRISFTYLDAIYEMYARKIHESDMFGFIVIEDFVFGEETTLVLDPAEERLKIEFAGVKRTFIPMQAVFRIDEVSVRGVSKVRDKTADQNKVTAFPLSGKPKL